ncbi:MAG TPA: PKD domain-containing protein, partial [bacterium]
MDRIMRRNWHIKYGIFIVFGLIFLGCGKNVLPPGPPEIVLPQRVEFCKGSSIEIGPDKNDGYEYYWEPAAGISDPTSHSIVVTPVSPTTYTLTVKERQTNLHSQFNITVSPMDLPVPSINIIAPAYCPGIAVNFDGSTSSAPASASITSYTWDFNGDGITDSTDVTPQFTFTSNGNYNITLTVTDSNGCSNSTAEPVTVNPSPVPIVTVSSSAVCRNSSLDFDGSSSSASPPATILSFAWDFNADSLVDSNAADPLPYTYTTAGATSVKLTIADSNGCSASGTTPVTVHEIPGTNFTSPAPQCLYDNFSNFQTINFTDASTPGSGTINSWVWNFGDSETSTAQDPAHQYISAGVFNVQLTVTNSNSCSASVVKPVTIYPNPIANAGADQDVRIGGTNNIGGITTGGTIPYLFNWSPVKYLGSATDQQPVVDCSANDCSADIGAPITYTLLVTDNNLCTSSDSVDVTIKSAATQLVAKAGT